METAGKTDGVTTVTEGKNMVFEGLVILVFHLLQSQHIKVVFTTTDVKKKKSNLNFHGAFEDV